MPHSFKLKPWLLAGCIMAIGATSIAWYQDNGTPAVATTVQDTTPKREKKVREKEKDETIIKGDIEESLKQVEKARVELQQQLNSEQWKKMQEQLAQSLDKLNLEKMQMELQQALKNIETEKIRLKMQQEMKQVDMEKLQRDLQRKLEEAKTSSEFDAEKTKQLIEKAMVQSKKAMEVYRKVDMEKIRKELEVSQEKLIEQQSKMKEEVEKAREHIQEAMKKDFRKELEKAQEGVKRAKEELQNYKNMLQEMEKEGLLSTKENYKVEYKSGDLFINGKQQPASIVEKYKHYFKKENVTIKHEEDDDKTIRL